MSRLLAALLVAVAVLLPTPSHAAGPATVTTVVVVGVPGLRWDDVTRGGGSGAAEGAPGAATTFFAGSFGSFFVSEMASRTSVPPMYATGPTSRKAVPMVITNAANCGRPSRFASRR